MYMFVRIYMRDFDSSGLQLAKLCGGFGFNLAGIQLAAKGCSRKAEPSATEILALPNEAGNFWSRKHGRSGNENEVTSDRQTWRGSRQSRGLSKSRAGRH